MIIIFIYIVSIKFNRYKNLIFHRNLICSFHHSKCPNISSRPAARSPALHLFALALPWQWHRTCSVNLTTRCV